MMKRIIIGIIASVLFVTGVNIPAAYAIENEYFKQANNIEFSSASATKTASGKFVYYSQTDPKWNSTLYGANDQGRTIGQNGCGPTSLAMIIATLVNRSVTPVEVANAGFENGSLNYELGTIHGPLLSAATAKWPFKQVDLTNSSIDELMLFMQNNDGYIYMGGLGPAPFTDVGHVVVIRSVDVSAGTMTIADPYRGEADVYNKEIIQAYRGTTIGITK